MSKSAFDQILLLLPKLDQAELENLRLRCAALGSIGPKQRTSISEMHQDWLLSGILFELEKRGLASTIPGDFYIRNKQSFGSYSQNADRVRRLFEENSGTRSSVDKLALGRLLARTLARRVEQFASVSLDTLLRNVGLIPEAFDAAFPDYINAGVLPFLIKAMHGGGIGATDAE